MERLKQYFTKGITSRAMGETIGMEVETQFVDQQGKPITVEISQRILQEMVRRYGWTVTNTKGALVTEITSNAGDRVLYELGRHNLELSTVTKPFGRGLVGYARERLESLYAAGRVYGAFPFFRAVIETDEDLLVVPDERDAIWLRLDGRKALNFLARCSAVQFTVEVLSREAMWYLNALGDEIDMFLKSYPQGTLWRRYVTESLADYNPLRYGGPLRFEGIDDYCRQLARHAVVVGPTLVPIEQVRDMDIPLFLRSVWWHFRLKRYGTKLCVEVRPIARGSDDELQVQFDKVMDIFTRVARMTSECQKEWREPPDYR